MTDGAVTTTWRGGWRVVQRTVAVESSVTLGESGTTGTRVCMQGLAQATRPTSANHAQRLAAPKS